MVISLNIPNSHFLHYSIIQLLQHLQKIASFLRNNYTSAQFWKFFPGLKHDFPLPFVPSHPAYKYGGIFDMGGEMAIFTNFQN